MKVDNAVILAAGIGQRFAPLTFEKHKALTVVKGEVLIERQIRQLIEAGVLEIYIVVGYKSEQFEYLQDKYGVKLVYNTEYMTRNNSSSVWYARDILHNSYVCTSDNYYERNLFSACENNACYTAQFSGKFINEWCMQEDAKGNICSVSVGGSNAWYMIGHAFWDEQFSRKFIDILAGEYDHPETYGKLWEHILIDHLDELRMKISKLEQPLIHEFDSLDELRRFDHTYYDESHSILMKTLCRRLNTSEKDIINIVPIDETSPNMIGFEFDCNGIHYRYDYATELLGAVD